MKVSWEKYIKKTSELPPRELMLEALNYVAKKEEALDIAAGALIDSKHLLKEGFAQVTAIDSDSASEEKAKEIDSEHFTFIATTIEDFEYKPGSYDLINAQWALPYVKKENFSEVLQKITNSLKHGGILTGQFFGERDGFNTPNDYRNFHSAEEVKNMFAGMEILKLEQEEEDKESALGVMKHFHTIHFIVRK